MAFCSRSALYVLALVIAASARMAWAQLQTRPSTAAGPATAQSVEMISLSFPPNLELKVLIRYVGDRLGINFLFDDQVVSQHVTIYSPVKIPLNSLLGLLEGVLKMKGLVIVDGDQPGWKKIVTAANLVNVASTTQASNPSTAEMEVFPLRYADPQKADLIIKAFLTQPGGNSIVLSEQHLLIVTDYVSTVRRVAELIQLIDLPPQQVSCEFVPIRNVDVAVLTAQLQQILTARDKAQTAGNNNPATVDLISDPRTNQLIVVGYPEKVGEAKALISSLDVPLPLETRVYQLKTLAPERLDRLVRELIDPADAKRLYQSAIDKDSGLLIATTTNAIHDRIAALQEKLDIPLNEASSPIRFYKLTNTTAADVLTTIRMLEGGEETSVASASLASPLPAAGPTAAGQTQSSPQANGGSSASDVLSATGSSSVPPGLNSSNSRASGTAAPPNSTASPPIVGVRTAKGTITADPNTNTIIVEADSATQKIYEGLIRALDKRRPQVLIECTLVTIDTSDNFSLGVELGADSVGSPRFITFNSFGLSTADATTGALSIDPAAGFNGTLLGSRVAQVVIQALQTNSRSKVLSAPRILVNDNATGTLSSVAEQPYTSENSTTTVSTTTFAGYATAGTTITLTPHISEADHLQLEYVVTLNNFTGQSSSGVPPPRQTDSIESKITIPDDTTVVVGGLNSSNFSNSRQSVPILGDIPLLQYLFSQRNRNRSTSTLFVFIRPVILRDDEFADLKYFSERDVKAAGLPTDDPQSEPLLIR